VELNEFETKYGTQAKTELMNKLIIQKGKNIDWRLFAIKYGLCTQATSKITSRYYSIERYTIEPDKYQHTFTLRNARNVEILYVFFNKETPVV
jgi:hypothetical protein